MLTMTGCGPSDEEKIAAAEAEARAAFRAKKAAAAAKAADPTATMARAVATGKADAPIDLKYDILARPIVGEFFEIELALIPTASGDAMSVSVAGSAGLILEGELQQSFGGIKVGQAVRVRVKAKANKEDVFYITVATTLQAAGVPSTRTYAIPILTSLPPAPQVPESQPAPDKTPAADTKKK